MPRDVRKTGRNHRERRPNRLLTQTDFEYVVEQVCKGFQINDKQGLWKKFKGNVAQNRTYRARQCVIHICWSSFDVDFAEIGAYFDLLKPITYKAYNQVDEWRGDDPELDKFLTQLEEDIIARRIAANG